MVHDYYLSLIDRVILFVSRRKHILDESRIISGKAECWIQESCWIMVEAEWQSAKIIHVIDRIEL